MTGRSRRWLLLAALGVLALLGGACEMRLLTEIVANEDGSGTFQLVMAIDQETASDLRDAGFEAMLGVDGLREAAPDWRIDELDTAQGVGIQARRDFASPAEVAVIATELVAALGPEDGAILDQLSLTKRDDGSFSFAGRAGVIGPTVAGADGEGVTFDGDDLAVLLAERGRDVVRHDLTVHLPGRPAEHDADIAAGARFTWELPVGELREVRASTEPITAPSPVFEVGLAALSAALVAGTVMAARRRRRDRVGMALHLD